MLTTSSPIRPQANRLPIFRGKSDEPSIDRLGFGCAPIGNLYTEITDWTADETMREAHRLGMRYFDTAPHYGFGLSEERLGRFVASVNRDELTISTKVGRRLEPIDPAKATGLRHGFFNGYPFEPVFDYTYDGIMRSFEQSLERLGVSTVDILYAHDLGEATHGAEAQRHWEAFAKNGYRAMQQLKSSGAVKAIGLGANEWQVCRNAMVLFDMDVFLLAGRYTLLEQREAIDFLAHCLDARIELVVGGPFNSGILATKGEGRAYYNYGDVPAEIAEKANALRRTLHDFGVPLHRAALQFPFFHPAVGNVLAGFASIEEVRAAGDALRQPISNKAWDKLRTKGLINPRAAIPGLSGELM
ncbi:aldo/keto reductase [Parvularcula sp. LCG005]|uniref:aldo/keto reductase n=1 Tax=Parvularcula sp. LCG005 TaxID=3078805 RepID=UPI0029432420|nr:aldo/keto reductase [Parvularcula sp. LCG005]WOI54813.1 aldo/keto reductase [Parvularcula sp. LCG005]